MQGKLFNSTRNSVSGVTHFPEPVGAVIIVLYPFEINLKEYF